MKIYQNLETIFLRLQHFLSLYMGESKKLQNLRQGCAKQVLGSNICSITVCNFFFFGILLTDKYISMCVCVCVWYPNYSKTFNAFVTRKNK